MRRLLSLKLSLLMVLWTVLCIVLYGVLAVGEAILEIGGSAAGAVVGQSGAVSGLADLAGDALQFLVGLMWVAGVIGLWIAKRVVRPGISQPVRPVYARQPPPKFPKARPREMKHVLTGASGRILARMLGRKT